MSVSIHQRFFSNGVSNGVSFQWEHSLPFSKAKASFQVGSGFPVWEVVAVLEDQDESETDHDEEGADLVQHLVSRTALCLQLSRIWRAVDLQVCLAENGSCSF